MELKTISQEVLSLLESLGAKEYVYEITESEKRELNTENVDFSLYRTIFDKAVEVAVYDNGKKGSSLGSDLSSAGLQKVVGDAVRSCEASPVDPANVIAGKEEKAVFHEGPYDGDMELFYDRLQEMMDTMKTDYPKVKILQIIADHTKTHRIYQNSSGTEFEDYNGVYHISVECAGNDGEKTTGLSYFGVTMNTLDKPFIELGNIRKKLEDTEKSLEVMPVKGKFEGTVIFTPDCAARFIFMLLNNYMGGNGIISGTSRWKDRLLEKVASDKITISLKTQDERLVPSSPYTADGYRAENVTLLEKGVLKSFVLDLYAAKKTGKEVTKNSGRGLVMENGDTPLEDMIKNVKKGMIVGGFSGGHPGANGDFSGVAKNSFYVEDGKIVGAVTETMINGNLEEVFNKVIAVSRELVSDGSRAFPYVAVEGIVISGK